SFNTNPTYLTDELDTTTCRLHPTLLSPRPSDGRTSVPPSQREGLGEGEIVQYAALHTNRQVARKHIITSARLLFEFIADG
ncbi:MAG: hypothetical protein AAF629_37245, partial [Chloroflexota bacterium]